jgi:hypothetical protein
MIICFSVIEQTINEPNDRATVCRLIRGARFNRTLHPESIALCKVGFGRPLSVLLRVCREEVGSKRYPQRPEDAITERQVRSEWRSDGEARAWELIEEHKCNLSAAFNLRLGFCQVIQSREERLAICRHLCAIRTHQ